MWWAFALSLFVDLLLLTTAVRLSYVIVAFLGIFTYIFHVAFILSLFVPDLSFFASGRLREGCVSGL